MIGEGQRYYGKYRGTVINNIDPMQLGRQLRNRKRKGARDPSEQALVERIFRLGIGQSRRLRTTLFSLSGHYPSPYGNRGTRFPLVIQHPEDAFGA